jgi:hypothetical protein
MARPLFTACLTPRGEDALKIAKRRFTRTFLGVLFMS